MHPGDNNPDDKGPERKAYQKWLGAFGTFSQKKRNV